MKLSLADTSCLKDSISVISELVNDVRFNITKQGLELVAMDPANVSMVIYKLLSSAFVEYELDKDKSISINLESLKQILRRVKPNDTIILGLNENKNQLEIKVDGESSRTFHIALLNLDEKEQRIPELSFPVEINTSSALLDNAIEDVGIVAESVALMADSDNFTISSEGSLSKAKVELKKGNNLTIALTESGKVISKYSLEYLKKMSKATKIADEVTIKFKKDYPLKLDYISKDKLALSFILAPRVSND